VCIRALYQMSSLSSFSAFLKDNHRWLTSTFIKLLDNLHSSIAPQISSTIHLLIVILLFRPLISAHALHAPSNVSLLALCSFLISIPSFDSRSRVAAIMKFKKILSRRSLTKDEDKSSRRKRSNRKRPLADEDAGLVFWEVGYQKKKKMALLRECD